MIAEVEVETAAAQILVVDDQPDVCFALDILLRSSGYRVATANSPAAVLRHEALSSAGLLLLDMNYTRDTTSGGEGLELIRVLRERGCNAPIIVMTAWGDIELAVEAMRRGATDFIRKPWDNARLLAAVTSALGERRARHGDSELDIARHVQARLLPRERLSLPSLDVAARSDSSGAVGGDFYDAFDVPGGRAFLLADVSGKGIAGAILMAHLQACFRSRAAADFADLARLVAAVNEQFHQATPPEQYATLFVARYDETRRALHYVNCGHPPPVLVRSGGGIERLSAGATALGLFPAIGVSAGVVLLAPGDRVAIVSDGILDAGLEQDQEFGLAGLIRELANSDGGSAETALDRLFEAVDRADGGSPGDDRTALLLYAR